MANSIIEIWNQALGAVGSSQRISSEEEISPQANVCRQWYDLTRKYVNRKAPWGCALSWSRLAVKAERDFSLDWDNGDPGPGWRFAYGLPENFLNAYYLQDYGRFELALHNGVPALHANTERAVLRYVIEQPQVTYWDNGFENAVVSLLAFRIAPQINGKLGARDRLRDEAFEFINLAIEEAANNVDQQEDVMADALVARGFGVISIHLVSSIRMKR